MGVPRPTGTATCHRRGPRRGAASDSTRTADPVRSPGRLRERASPRPRSSRLRPRRGRWFGRRRYGPDGSAPRSGRNSWRRTSHLASTSSRCAACTRSTIVQNSSMVMRKSCIRAARPGTEFPSGRTAESSLAIMSTGRSFPLRRTPRRRGGRAPGNRPSTAAHRGLRASIGSPPWAGRRPRKIA